MTVKEAIEWLQAILDDTLDPKDEGDAKRIEAVELAIEVLKNHIPRNLKEPLRVSSPVAAYGQVKHLARKRKEHLVGLYLDAQNRIVARETISIGSLNTTRTHPREVLEPAIRRSALAFILVHNHPSGSLEPSQEDVEFTQAIARAAEVMGINLYDHLIVSPRGFVSLKEKELL